MDYGASGKYGVAEISLPSLQGCALRGTQLPTCSEVLPTCSEVLPTCSEVLPTCSEVIMIAQSLMAMASSHQK